MRRPEFIARQSSRPSGLLGSMLARIMARETEADNQRALEHLCLAPRDRVLEIGFAHGHTIARAASLASEGFVAGIEVSERMLQMAKAYNKAAIRAGRVHLQCGDGDLLPYEAASFDKAYTVHTIYFWQEAGKQLDEIYRVLVPGGRFVLGYRHGQQQTENLPAPIYQHRSPSEIEALLDQSGFTDIMTNEDAPLYISTARRGD